ncbi:hypothetical protein BFP72_08650 [Reichenbachiella sp. 5M10]|nr:hypothetical protein BFP72_08650 [Reichenbachiella sp. 5M10]
MSFYAQAQEQGYKIKVTVKGTQDSVLYLGYNFGTKKYLQDTAKVKGETVVFEGNTVLKPGVYFLYSPTYYMELIVDEQRFEIETDLIDTYGDMRVKGSLANEQFRDFQRLMIRHQQQIRDLTKSIDSTATKLDSATVLAEMHEINELNEAVRDSLQQVDQGTFVGELLTLMNLKAQFAFEGDSLTSDEKQRQYNDFKDHYFDAVNFDSEGLLRTPIFEAKINEYVDKVTIQNPDSIISSINYLLTKSANNEEMYRYFLVTFFQKYQNHKIMGMDKVFVYLADEYYLNGKAPWANEAMLQELRDEMVFHRDNQIGEFAPQIYLQDTLGRPVNLYEVKYDYVILYFYSPTCGHCKKKTPVLKEVYDRLDEKVQVVAVDTDTDEDKWKAFIKELDLTWLNYADLGYKSNFRVQYNVRSTPVLYILDKDKRIIAKKLDVEQVEGFINEQIRRASL